MPSGGPKVALFLPNFASGGAERVTLNLAKELNDHGFCAELVVASSDGPFASKVDPSVKVTDLASGRVFKSIGPLSHYLRTERPAALLAAMNHANMAALIANRLSRTKTRLVVSIHNNYSEDMKNVGGAQRLVFTKAIKALYRSASAIVAVSEGVADDFAAVTKIPRQRIQVIYNPTVTPEILAKSKEEPAHPWFKDSTPVVLAVGRLSPQKDFPNLLRAFALVRKQRAARLIIYGEGPEKEQLEAMRTELGLVADTDFAGFTDNPYSAMRKSAVFAMSSSHEGLPGALIEALASGAKAIVSTDCPSGPNEILEGGKHGALVPVGDSEALAKAIIAGLDGELPANDGQRWQSFTSDKAVEAYGKVLVG